MVFNYAVKRNGRWYRAFDEIEERVEDVMPAPEFEEHDVDFSTMKISELKALCVERGIEIPDKANKVNLIKLLSE